jgi:peptide/nickel transport system permease protein
VDWALVAGGLFFSALVALAIYGPLVAPHDVYFTQSLVDGKAAPFPPSPEYPFGSDSIGRDRFSWLLIGARGSVAIAFAAAALRVLIGASLGLIAGFRGGMLGAVLRRIALGVSSVPAMIATLLAVIALSVEAEYFVLALGLIGWAEPFHQARRYSRSESARPFMESARSLGVSKRRLLLRHLLPNVAPQLLTTAAFQVSAVLLLMAELALLNIFVGGSVVVDYDARGNAIVAPKVPNWASMLASTRPIVSLYGDLASVLLPGGALLAAVVAINLFGDALAARAQRLDVFRLFSRRQLLGAATLALLVALSVNLWPSRLAAELDYAQGFNGARAHALARELTSLGPRTNGSPQADAAAALLGARIDGQILSGTEATTRVQESELRIAGAIVPIESVSVLSIADVSVRGPLVYLDSRTLLFNRPAPDVIRGAVVVIPPGSVPILALLPRLAAGGARALITLDMPVVGLPRDPALYPIPTMNTTTAVMMSAVRQPLPDLRSLPLHWVTLADEASVRITTERVVTPITDVIARVPGPSADAPLVVIAAAYDAAPGASSVWGTATASAVLVTALEQLRRAPLDVEVVALLTSGDFQDYAGLRRGLASLEPQQRERFQALVLIGPALSSDLVLSTEVSRGIVSGTGRLGSRLQEAMDLTLMAGAGGELQRELFAVGFSTTPLSLTAPGFDRAPDVSAIERSGRAVLAAIAYVPRHQSEMQ